MSVQMAMMAGAMALSAYSSVKQGQAQGDQVERQAQGQAMGQEIQEGQYRIRAEGRRLQAANEELSRRRGLEKLLSVNRGEITGRGVVGDAGSSAGVIEDYNRDSAEEDIRNIRFMGEHEGKMLDFGADSAKLNARQLRTVSGDSYRTAGWLSAASRLAMGGYSLMGGFGKAATDGGGGNVEAANSGMTY
jgi:hypothetical protein